MTAEHLLEFVASCPSAHVVVAADASGVLPGRSVEATGYGD